MQDWTGITNNFAKRLKKTWNKPNNNPSDQRGKADHLLFKERSMWEVCIYICVYVFIFLCIRTRINIWVITLHDISYHAKIANMHYQLLSVFYQTVLVRWPSLYIKAAHWITVNFVRVIHVRIVIISLS